MLMRCHTPATLTAVEDACAAAHHADKQAAPEASTSTRPVQHLDGSKRGRLACQIVIAADWRQTCCGAGACPLRQTCSLVELQQNQLQHETSDAIVILCCFLYCNGAAGLAL